MKASVFEEREQLTEEQKELFLCDIKAVCGEYFQADGRYTIDTTPTEKGISVCIIFDAARIKRFRKPR